MPNLDVSELVTDPDFATAFDIVNNSETMVNGEAVITPTTQVGVIGSVFPATTRDLLRLPEAERQSGGIVIYSIINLTTGDATHSADEIIWPTGTGRRYVVSAVDDYREFGAGMLRVTCRAVDIH